MALLERVVVVGASLAGLQAAQTMRREGFAGEIVMVGAEEHYPYDRPPLSKGFLSGEWPEEKLRLRAAIDPTELGLTWRLGSRAVALDLQHSFVSVTSNSAVDDAAERLDFDGLVIATGASARTLPGPGLSGLHVLRTLDDARALRGDLAGPPKDVVVIGAGFIGAEVAASARTLGHRVSLVEAAKTPMARVLDEGAGNQVAQLHRDHGVEVFLGVGVEEIQADDRSRVRGIALVDGTELRADVVVVGIGVTPNTSWLEGSGLTLDNGVVCDDTCMAAPGVVAAGDVARWPNHRFGGELLRVEQWDNAIDQGGYAARRLLAWGAGTVDGEPVDGEPVDGEPVDGEPYAPVPWFWSDQYDRKIQVAGITTRSAELVHGTLAEHRFAQVYLDREGAVVGALAWNRPRHAIKARQLIARGGTLEEARELLA